MKNTQIFLVLALLLVVPCFCCFADYMETPRTIRIGLEHFGRPNSAVVAPSSGEVELFDFSMKKTIYYGPAAEVAIVAKRGGQMVFKIGGKSITSSSTVSICDGKAMRSISSQKLTIHGAKTVTYRGCLEVNAFGQQLYFVSIVDIEDYLKSVVPAEISVRAPKSAQEAQAIAARTYAIRNIDRHTKKDNYNLCDSIHCQAYLGTTKEDEPSNNAIKSTVGQILVFNNEPANTVYHSNCGGYIISSQAAWGGKAVPYLIGHYDGLKGYRPFCDYGREHLKKNPKFTLPPKAKKLVVGVMPTKDKRKVHDNYGHRVGMCQDGAIGMSLIGYGCGSILGFYYPKTRIVTLNYAKKDYNAKKVKAQETGVLVAKADVTEIKKKDTASEDTKPTAKDTAKPEVASQTTMVAASTTASSTVASESFDAKSALEAIRAKASQSDNGDGLEIKDEATAAKDDETIGNELSLVEIETVSRKTGLIQVIKQISKSKPISTSLAIRKHYWMSIEPITSEDIVIRRRK